MTTRLRNLTAGLLLTGCVMSASALGVDPRIDVGGNALWVMPTNPVLRGNNSSNRRVDFSVAPVIEFSARNDSATRYGRWYPEARQGVGFAVQPLFPTDVLGHPALVYVMQSARIRNLSSRLSLEYEWNFGAAMGWKSFDHDSPSYIREQDCIGSPYTAYINIGLYLRYLLSDVTSLFGGVDLRHYSNGNTMDPNPGINMVGLRLGASVRLDGTEKVAKPDWSDFQRGWVVDAIAYGAWRKRAFHPNSDDGNDRDKDYFMIPGHFGVVGICVNPMYRFNPIVSVGPSLDAHFDEGANLGSRYMEGTPMDNPKFKRPSVGDRSTVGVSARLELRMALFGINIGVGHSVIATGGPDLRGWYNTFALKTFVTERLFLHTGYRLVRFSHQGNLMLGAGYRF